jgi:hypothetical protein
MRSLTRIINIELIFFAIATTYIFSRFLRKNTRYKFLLFTFVLSVVICDNYYFNDKSYRTTVLEAKNRTEILEKSFAQIPPGSVVSYEPLTLESTLIYYQIDAMLAAQKYNLKTLNGYTAFSPSNYGMYWNRPDEISRSYWLYNKKINHDILYVVNGENYVEKISLSEIKNFDIKSAQKQRLKSIINTIRRDEKWMKQIKDKAKERNVSIDTMIILDARWIIENEN